MPEVAVCTSRWLTIDRLSEFSRSSNASEPKPQALSNKNFRLNRSMVIKLFATYVGSKIKAETMRNGSRYSNLIQSIKTNSLKLKTIRIKFANPCCWTNSPIVDNSNSVGDRPSDC